MANNFNKSTSNITNNMGLLGWLFIVLFVLKLNPGGHLTTDVVHWSWWWVTAPLWVPVVLAVAIAFVIAISAAFLNAFGKK